MSKRWLLLWIFLSVVTCGAWAQLCVKDIQIILPAKPTPAELTAGNELVHYLGMLLNRTLTVDGRQITSIELGNPPEPMPDEAWEIVSSGSAIHIYGGGSRGTLYGAYHLLEDCFGVHWWTPQEEYVPPPADINLPELSRAGKPFFLYRDIYRTDEAADEGRFAMRNRLNRDGDREITAKFGGSFRYGSPYFVHTFDWYVKTGEYEKEHPEYFSLVAGKRVGGQYNGQLCLTNPEVAMLLTEKLREYIRLDREAAAAHGVPPPMMYDISQNDNPNYCECQNCTAALQEFGHSGVLLNFINRIATTMAGEFPDLWITTLAYGYSEETPLGDVRPAPNVIVRLCDTRTNQAVAISAEENSHFRELVSAWGKIANVHIWDYGIVYSEFLLPYPSEQFYSELHRFYADNGVTGIFWEHEYPWKADCYALKVWLEAKLLEDPYQDIAELENTFTSLYYGEAANAISAYRQLLKQCAAENAKALTFFAARDTFDYMDLDSLLQAHEIMDQAEAATRAAPEYLIRLQRARLGLDILTATFLPKYIAQWEEKGNDRKDFPLSGRAIAARLESFWPELNTRYGDDKSTYSQIQIGLVRSSDRSGYVPPGKFHDRRYYDFIAPEIRLELNSPGVGYVDDVEAENGVAIRFDCATKPEWYSFPVQIGCYKSGAPWSLLYSITQSAGPGYQWYYAGDIPTGFDGYVFLTKSWEAQAHLSHKQVPPDHPPLELWVRIKLEGAAFVPGSFGKSYIFIDRVTLVEIDSKEGRQYRGGD